MRPEELAVDVDSRKEAAEVIDKTVDRLREGVGGPKTPEGKAVSRRNAVKHGLRSERLALQEHQTPMFEELWKAFRKEYEPEGPTEEMLVQEIWRHSCFLHVIAEVEGATLRRVDQEAPATDLFVEMGIMKRETAKQWGIAGAVEARMELVTRYRRAHERGFYEALRVLGELQGLRREKERRGAVCGRSGRSAVGGAGSMGPPSSDESDKSAGSECKMQKANCEVQSGGERGRREEIEDGMEEVGSEKSGARAGRSAGARPSDRSDRSAGSERKMHNWGEGDRREETEDRVEAVGMEKSEAVSGEEVRTCSTPGGGTDGEGPGGGNETAEADTKSTERTGEGSGAGHQGEGIPDQCSSREVHPTEKAERTGEGSGAGHQGEGIPDQCSSREMHPTEKAERTGEGGSPGRADG